MCVFIAMEDLVANALIELMENTVRRDVRFSELEKYGAVVVKSLNAQGEEAVLVLSRNNTNEFLHNYSQYFEIKHYEEEEGIALKEEVTVAELRECFRGYLTLEVLKAFVSKESLRVLGV